MFCPRAGPSLQSQEHKLQFCRRQVFYRKLRNEGYSFTRDWRGAVAFYCFPHPTLSLASEQTLEDLKRSQEHQRGVRKVDLANCALRTSPKFTIGVKYQFHPGFWPDQRSRNPNYPWSHYSHMQFCLDDLWLAEYIVTLAWTLTWKLEVYKDVTYCTL